MKIKECPEQNGQYLERCLRYWFSLKYQDPIFPAATSPESLLDSLGDKSVTVL